ncbi:MAG: hypothetical protein H7338_06195 [Candidatus Sericytochromatia bacterium]|nr:hypothetical protein [Candidatus Sericytochromatia bacterium]
MKRIVLLLLLATGCAKAQETVLTTASSSDAWTVTAATRHGALNVGVNDIVIKVQNPMHGLVTPGDVDVKLVMTPANPQPSSTPPPVEMQPDGQPGHWLAIVELPQSDTWHCELSIDQKAVPHKVRFDLKN